MTTTIETLERRLGEDLRSKLGDRLRHDEKLAFDLYGALTGFAAAPHGEEAHLALSWQRAAEIVNAAREAAGGTPLDLFQSGREGVLTDRAKEALEAIGWELRPRRTDEFDPDHVSDPERPPRRRPEPPEWEREAHKEAELERLRRRLGETRDKLFHRHR
jgi:hypothetical protein